MAGFRVHMTLAASLLCLQACGPAVQWYTGTGEGEADPGGAPPPADTVLETPSAPAAIAGETGDVDPLKQKVVVLPFRNLADDDVPWKLSTQVARGLGDSLRKYDFMHVIPVDSALEYLTAEEREGEFGKGRAIELARLLGGDIIVMAEIEAVTMKRQRVEVPLGGYRHYAGVSIVNANLVSAVDGRAMGESRIDATIDVKRTGIVNPAVHIPLDREYFFLGEAPWGSEEFHKSLTGKAVGQCLRDLAEKVSGLVRPTPEFDVSSPKLIDIDGALAYINVGSGAAVKNGDKYGVYDHGRELKDPDTGTVLGYAAPRRVGVVQIEQVLNEKLSASRILDGAEKMKIGFTIRAE